MSDDKGSPSPKEGTPTISKTWYELHSKFPNIDQLTNGGVTRCLKEDPSYEQWFEFLEIYYKIGLEIASLEEIEWGFHVVSQEVPRIKERLETIFSEHPGEVKAVTKYWLPRFETTLINARTKQDKVIVIDYFAVYEHMAAAVTEILHRYTFGQHREEASGGRVIVQILNEMQGVRPPDIDEEQKRLLNEYPFNKMVDAPSEGLYETE